MLNGVLFLSVVGRCWVCIICKKKPNVPLFVVDVDNVNSMKSVELFGEIIEGNGETFAVRDGEIVRRGSKYGNGSDEFIGELIRSVQ